MKSFYPILGSMLLHGILLGWGGWFFSDKTIIRVDSGSSVKEGLEVELAEEPVKEASPQESLPKEVVMEESLAASPLDPSPVVRTEEPEIDPVSVVPLVEETRVRTSEVVERQEVVTSSEKVGEVEKIHSSEVLTPVENVAPEKSPPVSSEGSEVIRLERANYLKNPPPRYPEEARRKGVQGVVRLCVLIDERGDAARVEVVESSGSLQLDQAAQKAVVRWKFRPSFVAGIAVRAEVEIPVRFVLDARNSSMPLK